MSKELEAIKSLGEHHCSLMQKCESEECNIPCYECKYLKKEEIIEKGLRALEIVKNKRVNCFDVIDSVDYKHYLVLMEEYHKTWRLTKKEYDLLKEVLGDE